MRIIRFLSSNCAYIVWFVLYFSIAWLLLGADLRGFILASIIYGVSITVALCPIGEAILRITENCREPVTEQERAYLMPMFEEVYQNAKEINPKLNDGIKLYIMDAMYVNAFAMGRKTIAVTKGAIATFTEDELKGILAHELGHITYGHTKALLLSFIGNLFFSAIVWLFRLLLFLMQAFFNLIARFDGVGFACSVLIFIIRKLLDLSVLVFINLSQIILALNSRINETQADSFASEIGYGRELISGLYLIQKISLETEVRLLDKLKATHPHIGYRIGKLESFENEAIGT